MAETDAIVEAPDAQPPLASDIHTRDPLHPTANSCNRLAPVYALSDEKFAELVDEISGLLEDFSAPQPPLGTCNFEEEVKKDVVRFDRLIEVVSADIMKLSPELWMLWGEGRSWR